MTISKFKIQKMDRAALRKASGELLNQRQLADALPLLERLSSLEPKAADIHAALGSVYMEFQRFSDAARSFEQALACTSDRPVAAVLNLGRCLYVQGLVDGASTLLMEAFTRGVTDVQTLATLIDAHQRSGNYDQLLDVMRAAVTHHPQQATFWGILADELINRDLNDEALAAAKHALDVAPSKPAMQLRWAIALQRNSRFDEAITCLRSVIGAEFGNLAAHTALYDGLRAKYAPDALTEALEELLSTAPNDDAVRYQLARRLYEERAFERAMDLLNAMTPQHRVMDPCRDLDARVHLALGHIQAATAVYHKIWDEVAAEAKPIEIEKRTRQTPDGRIVKPIIYMPIEIMQREFASRVLTACFAAAQGFSSVIAPTRSLAFVADALPAGIFIHKTLSRLDRRRILHAAPAGHLFTAIDEESMGWTGSSQDIVSCVDPGIVPLLDLIFVSGVRHAQAYGEIFPESKARVKATGNPRIDLLAPRYQQENADYVRTLRAKYGDFVLICTNFASINSSVWGFREGISVFMRIMAPDPRLDLFKEVIAMGKGAVEAECIYIDALEDMLPRIAKQFPHLKFILRSHPGESTDYWTHVAANDENIIIDSDGPLQSWMAAAKTVVYMSGCATGMEAFLGGAPSIRLLINPDLQYPKYGLSSLLNEPASTAEDVADLIRRAEAGNLTSDARRMQDDAVMRDYFAPPDQPAASRLADAIAQLYVENGGVVNQDLGSYMAPLTGTLEKAAIRMERETLAHKGAAAKRVIITPAETESLVAIAREAFGIAAEVKVTKLSNEAVLISPVSQGNFLTQQSNE